MASYIGTLINSTLTGIMAYLKSQRIQSIVDELEKSKVIVVENRGEPFNKLVDVTLEASLFDYYLSNNGAMKDLSGDPKSMSNRVDKTIQVNLPTLIELIYTDKVLGYPLMGITEFITGDEYQINYVKKNYIFETEEETYLEIITLTIKNNVLISKLKNTFYKGNLTLTRQEPDYTPKAILLLLEKVYNFQQNWIGKSNYTKSHLTGGKKLVYERNIEALKFATSNNKFVRLEKNFAGLTSMPEGHFTGNVSPNIIAVLASSAIGEQRHKADLFDNLEKDGITRDGKLVK